MILRLAEKDQGAGVESPSWESVDRDEDPEFASFGGGTLITLGCLGGVGPALPPAAEASLTEAVAEAAVAAAAAACKNKLEPMDRSLLRSRR